MTLPPTLRAFAPSEEAEAHAEFERELSVLNFKRIRTAALFLTACQAVYFLVHELPIVTGRVVAARVLLTLLTLSFAGVTLAPRIARHGTIGAQVLLLTSVIAAIATTADAISHYHPTAVAMLIMGGAMMFSFSAVAMARLTLVVAAIYTLVGYRLVESSADMRTLMSSVFYVAAASFMAVLTESIGYRVRAAEFKARKRLQKERQLANELLHSMLPAEIVRRLKTQRDGIADSHDAVTVLFADLVGFTPLSEQLSSTQLVALLGDLVNIFDQLCVEHGLEKIKTIGDCYMAVAGCPVAREDHALAAVRVAIAMRRALDRFSQRAGRPLQLRIGLHSGPVIAGVIGSTKFAYDLWGDTVNTAARMETHAEPGQIQISKTTLELLDGQVTTEARGLVDVKGKGTMETFLVIR